MFLISACGSGVPKHFLWSWTRNAQWSAPNASPNHSGNLRSWHAGLTRSPQEPVALKNLSRSRCAALLLRAEASSAVCAPGLNPNVRGNLDCKLRLRGSGALTTHGHVSSGLPSSCGALGSASPARRGGPAPQRVVVDAATTPTTTPTTTPLMKGSP